MLHFIKSFLQIGDSWTDKLTRSLVVIMVNKTNN